MKKLFYILVFLAFAAQLNAQNTGFISSDEIKKKYPEALKAEKQVQSFVEEWKKELKGMQSRIDSIKIEISKNRLVWTEEERIKKEKDLKAAVEAKEKYAKLKFERGGEYDQVVKQIMQPVETKIFDELKRGK